MRSAGIAADSDAVVARLPTVDRFLPLRIGAATAAGRLLSRPVPGLGDTRDAPARRVRSERGESG